jgi:uncharacterized protein YndB with AHSA1/START domain
MTMHVDVPSGEPLILMTRTFDAPRDLVWTAFTDPRHVSKWYGGSAFGGFVRAMDVRKGGLWQHTMRFPDGREVEIDFVYVEVIRPERLVWTNAPAKPLPPGMMNVQNTVTLEEAGKRTRWKLVARFESLAERDGAVTNGFARVIEAGSDTLNDLVCRLFAEPTPAVAR